MKTYAATVGLAVLSSALSSYVTGGVFATSSAVRQVITPELSAFVKNALEEAAIPGLSMGVVRLDESRSPTVELAAWGKQTEEGDGNDVMHGVEATN